MKIGKSTNTKVSKVVKWDKLTSTSTYSIMNKTIIENLELFDNIARPLEKNSFYI